MQNQPLKLLLVLTGGTIGSVEKDGIVNVNPAGSSEIPALYSCVFGEAEPPIQWVSVQPMNQLSENLVPADWLVMARTIEEQVAIANDYAGVILLHGSDTLSYTSAAMGYLLQHLPIPVVLTAANYPIKDARSNGLVNLKASVDWIATCGKRSQAGVYTIFENNKKECVVYLATRIREADARSDQYSAWGGEPLGIVGQNYDLNNLASRRETPLFAMKYTPEQMETEILMLSPYPGMRLDTIVPTSECKAILCMLYHSATANVMGEHTSFAKAIAQWKSQGIPCYLCGFTEQENYEYETTKRLLDAGGIPLGAMSPEAAYAKLWLWYLAADDARRPDLFSEWYGELS